MSAIDWDAAPRVAETGAVDRRTFDETLRPAGKPVVLRGLVAGWPIVSLREERAALARIRELGGAAAIEIFEGAPAIRGRFFYNPAMDGFNFERKQTTVAALCARLAEIAEAADPPSIYAGAIPLRERLPRLAAETRCPLLDPAGEMLVSLWLGNRTRVASHWDLPQNLICCVAGRRRYILLPPEQLPNLYVGPLDFTVAGQPMSLVDFLDPDFEAHPRFRRAAEAAEVAVLEPGDALFLPSMWWHHAESLDPVGAMVNFWWRDGPAHLSTPMLTLLHALLTLRDMPAGERAHWRGMFDHYIFGADGGEFAHLSPEQRGVFGPATPERLRLIRTILERSLR